jgi:zinc transport system substrate-binding protein
MKHAALFSILALATLLPAAPGASAAPLQVAASILPQQFFIHKIGGPLVNVTAMVQPGANPHTYEPKPRQMAALENAAAFFAIGFPFEHAWLPRFRQVNPKMAVFHTGEGVAKRRMEAHDRHEGEHGEHAAGEEDKHGAHEAHGGAEHSHEGLDPHIWVSPPAVKIIAKNIERALISLDPEHKAEYEANGTRFQAEIEKLDQDLRLLFKDMGDARNFMVFHPAWGYFADAYGLKEISIEMEGKEPKPAELAEIIEHGKELKVKALFIQPQFSKSVAETVAKALGAQLVTADGLALDWEANLRDVARQFREAVR